MEKVVATTLSRWVGEEFHYMSFLHSHANLQAAPQNGIPFNTPCVIG